MDTFSAVPNENKEAYRALAEMAAIVFKDHGALSVVGPGGRADRSVHAFCFGRPRRGRPLTLIR
jgi:hypothetical protein